ncbi:MAG: hypothetical protein RMA76_45340 [Deltaproteobacteria bacterium]
MIVHALVETPAIRRLGMWALRERVQRIVGRSLRDGEFDFTPLLRELLRIDGVTEKAIYVGIVNIIGVLASMGIASKVPAMALDPDERSNILQVAEAATHSSRAAYELRRLRAAVTRVAPKQVGQMLVDRQYITHGQLDEALEAQTRYGRRLGTNLIEMGYLNLGALAHCLGEQLGTPCVAWIGNVDAEVIASVPRELVQRRRVFPLELEEFGGLQLGMEDPLDIEGVAEVEAATGRSIRPVVVPEKLLTYAMVHYYQLRQPVRLRGTRAGNKDIGSPKYELQSSAVQRYSLQGETRGALKGRAAMLLRVLERRGLTLTDDQRVHIRACDDVECLERWLDRALDATSVDEVLADERGAARDLAGRG